MRPIPDGATTDTPFHFAVRFGHLELVSKMIADYSCHASVKGSLPLLCHACMGGNLAMVRKLIEEYCCDPLETGDNGDSSLHAVAKGSQVLKKQSSMGVLSKLFNSSSQDYCDVIIALIRDYQCSPECVNSKGQTPLHVACLSGDPGLVRLLLTEFKADSQKPDEDGNTAAHCAAEGDHIDVFRLLVTECGSSVDCVNFRLMTPLHIAYSLEHLDFARALVEEFKANPSLEDINGKTPLQVSHQSRYHGDHGTPLELSGLLGEPGSLTRFLRESGGIAGLFGENGGLSGLHVPSMDLHTACRTGNLQQVCFSISQPLCDILATDDDGNTALHVAAQNGHLDIVQKVASKYNPDSKSGGMNAIQRTPLHLASIHGHTAVARFLAIRFLEDLDARDSRDNTAVSLAALNGRSSVVCMFITEFHQSPMCAGFKKRTLLHNACDGGHLVLARKLITEFHCDPMALDDDGCTPLHVASFADRQDLVKELVTVFRCPVSSADSDGDTPLHLAASSGRVLIVKLLLRDLGADRAARNSSRNTPLNIAALNGRIDIVDVLIKEFGCDPNEKGFDGRTPLLQACDSGKLHMIERLVSEYGCDVMARDENGCSSVHIAALRDKVETIRELVHKYKCNVNCTDARGQTPLHIAASRGHTNAVRVLVAECGANMMINNAKGDKALNLAALKGHTAVVTMMISELGCSPDTRGQGGRTPLHMACMGHHTGTVEKLLSQLGADLNEANIQGYTALHLVALAGDTDLVKLLVTKFNATLTIRSSSGHIPLHDACQGGHIGVVRMMIDEFNCDLSLVDNGGNTALHHAAFRGKEELVKVLVQEYKCDVDCVNYELNTPLHLASRKGHTDTVRTLVTELGASVSLQDIDGDTPVTEARKNGHMDIFNLLSQVSLSTSTSLLHKGKETTECQEVVDHSPSDSQSGHCLHVTPQPLNNLDLPSPATETVPCLQPPDVSNILAVLERSPRLTVSDPHTAPAEGDSSHTQGHDTKVPRVTPEARPVEIPDVVLETTPEAVPKATSENEVLLCETTRNEASGSPIQQDAPSLLFACTVGNLESVCSLTSDPDCDFMTRDGEGNTPLHVAAQKWNPAIIQHLIATGRYPFDTSLINHEGQTPLHIGCLSGNTKIIRALAINFPGDLAAHDGSGNSPLHAAASKGNKEVVKILVTEFKCALDCKNSGGDTPVGLASLQGHIDVVRLCIEQLGFDPETRGYNGRTLLHQACDGGHVLLAEQVITRFQCDPMAIDSEGCTPAYIACISGKKDVVSKLLTDFKCPADCKDSMDRTLLHGASASGNVSLVRMLISEYGLDIMAVDEEGNLPIHHAALNGHSPLVRVLAKDYKCPIDCVTFELSTPLHLACQQGHTDTVRVLVTELAADTSLVDSVGTTPLEEAIEHNHDGIVALLIDSQNSSRAVVPPVGSECTSSTDLKADLHFDGSVSVTSECEVVENGHCRVDTVPHTPTRLSSEVSKTQPKEEHLASVKDLLPSTDYEPPELKAEHDSPNQLSTTELALLADYEGMLQYTDGQNRSVLHHAAALGTAMIVAKLVEKHRMDIMAKDHQGATPLHAAALHGNLETIRKLITLGCPVDVKSDGGHTPLHCACQNGNIEAIKMLVSELKSDPLAMDGTGSTPLHQAAVSGQPEAVRVMVREFNCPVDCVNSALHTPLYFACFKGLLPVVEVLFRELGANPYAIDAFGSTPIGTAKENGHMDVVNLLRGSSITVEGALSQDMSNLSASNVQPPRITEDHSQFFLHRAATVGDANLLEELVVNRGMDYMAKDSQGATPLHVAALHGKIEAMKKLIALGCPADVRSDSGHTPLHCACQNGHIDAMRMLVSEYKCDPLAMETTGSTPIHQAAVNGQAEAVRVMVREFNCPVNSVNSALHTPLYYACHQGFTRVVEVLFKELGADPYATDAFGVTPVGIAQKKGHTDIANILTGGATAETQTPGSSSMVVHNAVPEDRDHATPSDVAAGDAMIAPTNGERQNEQIVPKLIILGCKGAGKTTLIQAMGAPVSSKPAPFQLLPLHSQGADVAIYEVNVENSVDAIVLERLMQPSCSVSILVVSLSQDHERIVSDLISCCATVAYANNRERSGECPKVVIVGSHADLLQEEGYNACSVLQAAMAGAARQCESELRAIELVGQMGVNCCNPAEVRILSNNIEQITTSIDPHTNQPMSVRALSILRILAKDFSETPVSTAAHVMSHLKTNPATSSPAIEPGDIQSCIKELDDLKFILPLLEKEDPMERAIVLDLKAFLRTGIEKLQTVATSVSHDWKHDDCGIVSMEQLVEAFSDISDPADIQELLKQLHCCEEILEPTKILSAMEINPTCPNISEDSKLFFFPEVINHDYPIRRWRSPLYHPLAKGLCICPANRQQLFPSRFKNSMLLDLASTIWFPDMVLPDVGHTTRCRCWVWSDGIQGVLESGVEGVVEVVNGGRYVVVMVRGEERGCDELLSTIMDKVFDITTKCCPGLETSIYSIHPDDLRSRVFIPELGRVRLFDHSEIQSALLRMGVGAGTEVVIPNCKLTALNFWDILFPLEASQVLEYLQLFDHYWKVIGQLLGAQEGVLEWIHNTHPKDQDQSLRVMIEEWVKTSNLCPCWGHLVQALRHMKLEQTARRVVAGQGAEVQLQLLLLDVDKANHGIEEDFLKALGDMAGSKWPSLAALLCFTTLEIEKVKERESPASTLLKRWKLENNPTYGDLLSILRAPLMFPSFLIQPGQLASPHKINTAASDCHNTKLYTNSGSKVLQSLPLPRGFHTHHLASKPTQRNIGWKTLGLSFSIPPEALPQGTTIKVAVQCLQTSPFTLPKGLKLVSPVYLVATAQNAEFARSVQIVMKHSAQLSTARMCSQLTFIMAGKYMIHGASTATSATLRLLSPIRGGQFKVSSHIGRILLDQIDQFAIAIGQYIPGRRPTGVAGSQKSPRTKGQ